MKKSEWFDALEYLDSTLIDNYITKKEKLRRKNKTKNALIRSGAAAACAVIVISSVTRMPLFNSRSAVKPYIPNGSAWSPEIGSKVESTVLEAEQLGELFTSNQSDGATNRYKEVYAPSEKYLNISLLPVAEYLPIYSTESLPPSELGFKSFIDEHTDLVSSFFGVDIKDYEIKKDERRSGGISYKASIKDGIKHILFETYQNKFTLKFSVLGERIWLNGSYASVLDSDTDEEIKEKVKNSADYICSVLDFDYTDIIVKRNYSYRQLESITLYLYTPEKTVFPTDFSDEPMVSQYVSLVFRTDTYNKWYTDKDEAFLTNITLCRVERDLDDYYSVNEKAKMISLEEAEALLAKGYVFSGHICELCMAEQPEIDFENYDYVDVEYVSDNKRRIFVPFYAFYKYIGETNYSMGTYAKTYVPAVEVEGIEEYFDMQIKNHPQSND